MSTREDFQVGDLVRYIPGHAHGDRNHPDVETGVVTSIPQGGDTVFVLFSGCTSASCYPGDLVRQARSESIAVYSLIQYCQRRGHRFLVSRIEWERYKGALPMPCPHCAMAGE